MTIPERRYFPVSVPRKIAHRGLADRGDENTLEAFERAIAAGADVIETDTRACADGVALTFHDDTTGRVASADLVVSMTRYERLKRLSIGESGTLTSLEDALGSFPRAYFNIDVKDRHAIVPTARAIKRTGAAGRVLIAGFDESVATTARDVVEALTGTSPRMSASRSRVAAFRAATAAELPQAVISRILRPVAALQIPVNHGRIPLVTERTVAAAHKSGCEVHVWTIDDASHMEALVRQGVDGIVTNRVDELVRVVSRADRGAHGRDS